MSVLTRPDVRTHRSTLRLGRSSRSAAKRGVDVVGAGVGLLLLLPFLAVVGLIVALTSPGGAIYRQTRVGLDGQYFSMVKFRTMRSDSEAHLERLKAAADLAGPLFKLADDPRITPVGRILRRFSIDELPQLWNVLRGDMSLVGPRPALPCEVDAYCDRALRRLDATPGMTGAWQVGGRSTLDWESGLDLDLHYVEHWSLRYDAVLLLKTVRAVVAPVGAY
jgi:lipopolysaccharide/colanic/teichoic acid biosynthesis glycosyltransferase